MNSHFAIFATLALAAGTLLAGPAQADDDRWMIRLRALRIAPADTSDAVPALGLPSDQIHVSSKWAPDFDVEYFLSRAWSTELLLTVPQRHDVTLPGVGTIGSFKHLPPTLTLKYDFRPDSVLRPYVGAGLNVTFISDVNITVPASAAGGQALPLKLERTSVGPAAQAGIDFKLSDRWFANIDAKYVQIRSDVKLGDGTRVSRVKVDPWLLGAGGGYRF